MNIRQWQDRLSACLSQFASSDTADFTIIVALVLYLLLGPYQHFPPPGWVDPAIYIGYFRNLGGLVARYGPTYFVDRWPLGLSGRVFYATLPLNLANAALVAAWYSGALLGLLALLRPTLAAPARKLVLVLYGSSPLIVATVTRSYADGPAITFLLIGMAAVWTGTLGDPSRGRLFIAGLCLVFGLLVQPGSVFAWAPMLAGLLFVDRHRLASWLPAAVIAGASGSMIALLVYMAVVYWITGTPDMFTPILSTGGQVMRGLSLQYREPLAAWLFPQTRLWFVALVIAAGFWTMSTGLMDRVSSPLRRLHQWTLISAVGSLALMAASDISIGTAALQFSFYASYLLPASYILLGVVVTIWLEAMAPDRPLLPLAVAVGLGTMGSALFLAATADSAPSSDIFPILVIACAALAVFAMLKARRARSVTPVLALLLALCPLSSVNVDTRHVFRGSGPAFGDTFSVLNQAADMIDKVASQRDIVFWFNRDEFSSATSLPLSWTTPYHQLYPLSFGQKRLTLNALDSLNAFYLWDRSRLNAVMPILAPDDVARLRRVRDPRSIVVLSDRESDSARASAALDTAGIPVIRRANRTIVGRSLTLNVTVLDVAYLERPPNAAAVALLDHFPCAETANWLTSWVNRPDLLPRQPEAATRLSTLLQGLETKPVDQCFAEADAVLRAIDLDWRPEHVPPEGASCSADLALANTYYKRVLNESTRRTASDAFTRALDASMKSDPASCLVATAALRDAYREAIGAPIRQSLPLTERIAGVRGVRLGLSYPVGDTAEAMLARFPCREATRWLTHWIDRPDLVPRFAEAQQTLGKLLQEWGAKPAERCAIDIERASRIIALDWGTDNPPVGADCGVDLDYAGALLDRGLDTTVAKSQHALFERAVADHQAGRESACLIGTATIRTEYRRELARAGASLP